MQDIEATRQRRKASANEPPGSTRAARSPNKLRRDPEKSRTYSFSPGRENIYAAKGSRGNASAALPSREGPMQEKAAVIDPQVSGGHGVQSNKGWQRVPTLHKRKSTDMPRRKSSKRRKEDNDREAEIKAMSAFMPKRPATFDHLVGRPMKRDSQRMKDGLNRNFTNPSSDISVPTAESMASSMTSKSDKHASYKLKGLFSPHPTLRYAGNPRYASVPSGIHSADTTARRRTLAEKPISKETMKANKRVDDLADDLTAGDIRELMERDKKRKEKKQLADQIKMESRLARRAEKQRVAELEAARNGTPPPRNLDRGVVGRELAGLGIVGMAESIKRKVSNASSIGKGKRPSSPVPSDPFRDPVSRPVFNRAISLATDGGSVTNEELAPIVATAQVARLSRASMSQPGSPALNREHARKTSRASDMMDVDEHIPPVPILDNPETSTSGTAEASARQPQSWRSFFKRRSTNKRSSMPSSFSNTSRESALANPRPSQTYEIQRSTSNLPKRTMSRFREDLPELPLSPPDSRVQSPEADELPPIHTGFPKALIGEDTGPRRHDTPTSGYRSQDAQSRLRTETPTSGDRSAEMPSPEPVAITSQSMASIDSEGSWLSGRPRAGSKRASLPPHPLRASASSLENRYKSLSDSHEELGIAEDEYFSRLTPGPDEMFEKSKHRMSGNPMASSDEEDESVADPTSPNTKWGAVAKQPTVVRRDQRVKSREGLLTEFNKDAYGEDDDDALRTPISPIGDNDSIIDSPDKGIQRAISVSVPKGHARQVSAGSAKLLVVKPRGSSDLHRLSMENRVDEN